ncbi:hypothetical protein [Nocardia carnea]|uniref:hypothetical protein n=1 Tax=Nocardia carnea TaxID=37328 RepID=UPI002457A4BA|nr:hypothetical protein [Nocardia carnea]
MASPSSHHPRRKGRWFRRISPPALAAAALLSLAIPVVSAPSSDAAGIDGSIAGPAGLAVVALTSAAGPAAAQAIPHDFESYTGYRPVVRQGVLVAPDGDCSSPVELPPEFDTACMAHDLGYDLLRYADSTGAPLGPWARQAVDNALGVRLHQACDAHTEPMVRTRCETLAEVAATAVELNSRRQHYGVPVVETFTQAATQAATEHPTQPWLLRMAALAVTAIAGLVLGIRRLHRRRRRPATAAGHRGFGLPLRPSTITGPVTVRRRRLFVPILVRFPVDPPLPHLPHLPLPGRPPGRAAG